MAPTSTLSAIRTKVRRLTRTPSTQQLSDADLDQYINTFVVYDFPEHLRTFNLRIPFTFVCNPNQDTYVTDTSVIPVTDPLYDFQNRYLTVHEPIYIGGYPSMFSQAREQFFGLYPLTNSILTIGQQGDGITTFFSGTLSNVPVIANNVLFSSVDVNDSGLALIDEPNNPWDGTGVLRDAHAGSIQGTINYVTGVYSFTFINAPRPAAPINSQTVPYVAARPQALLYHNNTFTLRPVPDQPYRISFEVWKNPTELLASNQQPELNEYWQYIAFQASKKILEDRMDFDTLNLIMPSLKEQECLCLRRTLVQYSNQRAATIYTEATDGVGYGPGFNGYQGGAF